jgi:hypothetical protein
MNLESLGITKDDIIDRAADKLIECCGDGDFASLATTLERRVADVLLKESSPKIDAILAAALEKIVDLPFTPVDEWGEPKKVAPTTLREMVKAKALAYLTEKVDDRGQKTPYHEASTRAAWLASKVAAEAITGELKREVAAAVDAAKSTLQAKVAQFIAARLLA